MADEMEASIIPFELIEIKARRLNVPSLDKIGT